MTQNPSGSHERRGTVEFDDAVDDVLTLIVLEPVIGRELAEYLCASDDPRIAELGYCGLARIVKTDDSDLIDLMQSADRRFGFKSEEAQMGVLLAHTVGVELAVPQEA